MAGESSMTYEEAIKALIAYRNETKKSQRTIAKELGIRHRMPLSRKWRHWWQ